MSATNDDSGNDYGRGAIIIIVMMSTAVVIDMNVIVD